MTCGPRTHSSPVRPWTARCDFFSPLSSLAASPRVVDLDGRVARLVPVVVAGFALQTLTGALTYLLPVVFGRGAWGNRRLAGILELGWPLRVAAVNLGVLGLVAGVRPAAGWIGIAQDMDKALPRIRRIERHVGGAGLQDPEHPDLNQVVERLRNGRIHPMQERGSLVSCMWNAEHFAGDVATVLRAVPHEDIWSP
jgi:hypothetical protein